MTLTIKWVGPPRSFGEGRARQLRYVTLHYTAGSEGPQSAENGAAYDKARTDGTSCHYFVDSLGPALQEVHDEDTSYSAFPKGNALGIHIELCGTAQTRAQWLDATSRATLQTAAELVAYLLKKHNLPNHRLSVAETRAAWYADAAERYKYEGYNDHGTVTRAYPEDGGTHTDLGAGFPWDVFTAMITDAYEGDEMSDLFPKAGDKSEGVKYLQRRLVALGYLTATQISGTYDAATTAAVKKYRSERVKPEDVGSGTSVTGWMVNSMDVELAAKRGKPGPEGPQGEKGEQGPKGDAAVIEAGSILVVQQPA